VLLHPSDLIVRGKERDLTRAHALLTEHLTFTRAYQTWTKEANQVEDRLEALWREAGPAKAAEVPAALKQLQQIGQDMARLEIPYEEWEVLFREKLILERALLRVAAGLAGEPEDATEARGGAGASRHSRPVGRRAAADSFPASQRG
jgi:hypothetical protein